MWWIIHQTVVIRKGNNGLENGTWILLLIGLIVFILFYLILLCMCVIVITVQR